jgi:predicted MFS family arabinose efflux permease
LSLAVAGQSALALRLGRNARFGAIGNAMGAALMGAVGYYISERSVFFVTAALTLPAMVAILPIARFSNQPFPEVERRSPARLPRKERIGRVLGDRRLLIFAGFVMLATLANAALLPLAGSAITKRAADAASLVIAASIVLPQLIMALISPAIGRIAEARGRRPILLLGSAMFPVRGVLLAVTTDPSLVVLFQLLDGIAAACFGVMVPLVTADITGRSGHLNLALGFVGFAMGIGATLSTTVAGWIADHYGDPAAFAALAFAGLAGLALVWLAMPETRPAER